MANTPDHHAKLMIGEQIVTIATLKAELERLREHMAQCETCKLHLAPPQEPKA